MLINLNRLKCIKYRCVMCYILINILILSFTPLNFFLCLKIYVNFNSNFTLDDILAISQFYCWNNIDSDTLSNMECIVDNILKVLIHRIKFEKHSPLRNKHGFYLLGKVSVQPVSKRHYLSNLTSSDFDSE